MKPQGSATRGKTSGTGQGKPGATLRFGPAGWMYKDWEGIVYPHPKPPRFDQLRYIAKYFDAVEINSTYYGPPLARTATSYGDVMEGYAEPGKDPVIKGTNSLTGRP